MVLQSPTPLRRRLVIGRTPTRPEVGVSVCYNFLMY